MSIDVAIPADRNVIKKKFEKLFKYKCLKIEIQRMCNVTPIITGETGTISKSLTQYLSKIPGTCNGGITKTSHIVQCTYIADSVNTKVQNILHVRNNITCSTDCKYRTVATLNTVETGFVSGT